MSLLLAAGAAAPSTKLGGFVSNASAPQIVAATLLTGMAVVFHPPAQAQGKTASASYSFGRHEKIQLEYAATRLVWKSANGVTVTVPPGASGGDSAPRSAFIPDVDPTENLLTGTLFRAPIARPQIIPLVQPRAIPSVDVYPALNTTTLAPSNQPSGKQSLDSAPKAAFVPDVDITPPLLQSTLLAAPISRPQSIPLIPPKAAVEADVQLNALVLAAVAPASQVSKIIIAGPQQQDLTQQAYIETPQARAQAQTTARTSTFGLHAAHNVEYAATRFVWDPLVRSAPASFVEWINAPAQSYVDIAPLVWKSARTPAGVTPIPLPLGLPVDTNQLQPKFQVQVDVYPNMAVIGIPGPSLGCWWADGFTTADALKYTADSYCPRLNFFEPTSSIAATQGKYQVQADQIVNLLPLRTPITPLALPLGLPVDIKLNPPKAPVEADQYLNYPVLNAAGLARPYNIPLVQNKFAVEVDVYPALTQSTLFVPLAPLVLPLGLPVDTSEWRGKFAVQVDVYPNTLILGYPPPAIVPPAVTEQPSGRRRVLDIYRVKVDGHTFEFRTLAEAIAFLEKAKGIAAQAVREAMRAATEKAPKPAVLRETVITSNTRQLRAYVRDTVKEINALYRQASIDAEIGLLFAMQREKEEEENINILLMF